MEVSYQRLRDFVSSGHQRHGLRWQHRSILYALELASGTQKWKFKTTEGPRRLFAAVENGVVYFGSYDGNFYAVDAATGQLKWKFATPGERRFAAKHLHGSLPAGETMPDPFDCYLSSPVVSGARFILAAVTATSTRWTLVPETVSWKFQTGDVVHASPAISDGMLFVGSWDSYFYALDAATGKEKWKFKTGEDHEIYNQVGIQSSAAVADGIVYFGCRDSNLYALDARHGRKTMGLQQQRVVGDRFAGSERMEKFILRLRTPLCSLRWTPSPELRFSPWSYKDLADVRVAGHSRRLALHQGSDGGQTLRHRLEDPEDRRGNLRPKLRRKTARRIPKRTERRNTKRHSLMKIFMKI